ncbi:MAG: PilZ domain-containing protein [Bdellovibrio sp.]
MSKTAVKKVIYLGPSQGLPPYLQQVQGVLWHQFQDVVSLKQFLMSQNGDLSLVVQANFISLKLVKSFLGLQQANLKLTIIFIAQTIEIAAYQLSLSDSSILFLYESEGERLSNLVTLRIHRGQVKSRKHQRTPVQTQVMVKKSVFAENSPVGGMVQFLRDGEMRDFSPGGARVALKHARVREKDFISLMYQNHHGLWVSVESQVRWVVSTVQGEQIIGVQFLAVSA